MRTGAPDETKMAYIGRVWLFVWIVLAVACAYGQCMQAHLSGFVQLGQNWLASAYNRVRMMRVWCLNLLGAGTRVIMDALAPGGGSPLHSGVLKPATIPNRARSDA